MHPFKVVLIACLLSCVTVAAQAQEYSAGPIKVSGVWTREIPRGSTVASGYLTITNTGKEPDTLIKAAVDIAGSVEVHEMSISGGVMSMRPLASGLVIGPGQTVALKPGSFHLMLNDVKAPPKMGNTVKGTLTFERAGVIAIEFKVEPLGSRGPAQSGAKQPDMQHGGTQTMRMQH